MLLLKTNLYVQTLNILQTGWEKKDESISPKNRKRLDKLEKKIAGVLKKGFKFIPTKKRVKMLEEQKKRIEESEECFKTDRKQLEKQFTL